MMVFPSLFRIAAILGFLGVALGAFGAHGLSQYLTPIEIARWEKAVFYHFIHTLAIFGCGVAANFSSQKTFRYAALLFLLGISLFSGSLYLLATMQLTGISGSLIGPLTPLGGIAFMAGWGAIGVATYRK